MSLSSNDRATRSLGSREDWEQEQRERADAQTAAACDRCGVQLAVCGCSPCEPEPEEED